MYIYIYGWRFPEMGVPLNHPSIYSWIFHYKPSIFGCPCFRKPPYIYIYMCIYICIYVRINIYIYIHVSSCLCRHLTWAPALVCHPKHATLRPQRVHPWEAPGCMNHPRWPHPQRSGCRQAITHRWLMVISWDFMVVEWDLMVINGGLTSGKHTKNYGKIHHFIAG